MPTGVGTGSVEEVGPAGRAVVGGDRHPSGDVDRAATLHARVGNDGRTVSTDVEVVYREFAQGFELFVQDVLVDDRLTVLARFHGDAIRAMWYQHK